MDMMRISIPLAGMDPTPKVDADGRDQAAERAFRMLSEGKREASWSTIKYANICDNINC